jgi:hypothetical protein
MPTDSISPDTHQHEAGPFDLIGDVHGCAAELEELLERLGYHVIWSGPEGFREYIVTHPSGRRPVFLGDLVDRGPRSPDVMRLVMAVVAAGTGFCVIGNHDDKYRRWMEGRSVKMSHGIAQTVEQHEQQSAEYAVRAKDFLERLPHHLILDEGRLVVAHAGLREDLHGQVTGEARAFAMFGQVTGEKDEYGLTIRLNWAAAYAGRAMVVHGHVAEPDVREENGVICIDTGCVFGGRLTAYRWPERETVQVPAKQAYVPSPRWSYPDRA